MRFRMNGSLMQSTTSAGASHLREYPPLPTDDTREERIARYMQRVDNGQDIFTSLPLNQTDSTLLAVEEDYDE